jgi:hypothetical protein
LNLSCGTQCLCACCRFIVQHAAICGGVVVSNDTYDDLLEEYETWKEVIQKRLVSTVVVSHCIFLVLLTFKHPLLAYVNALIAMYFMISYFFHIFLQICFP